MARHLMNVICHACANLLETTAATAPDHHTVAVWIVPLPHGDDDWPHADGLLDADERWRAASHRDRQARRRFVFGRVFLRRLLGACCGIAPDQLVIRHDRHGKPWLAHPHSHLKFNVTHSRALVAIALTCNHRVGIDVEWMDPQAPLELLARRALSPRELSRWQTLAPWPQARLFYQVWTCKEAILKAIGAGLKVEPSSFSVLGDTNGSWGVYGTRGNHHGWSIQPLSLPGLHTGAVAVAIAPFPRQGRLSEASAPMKRN